MYMDEMEIYLTAPPDLTREASERGPVSAQAFRVGRDLRLYEAPMGGVRPALMDVDASAFSGYGPHEALVNRLVTLCRRRGYRGMAPDLPRPNQGLLAFCACLDRASARYGLELYLPERYAGAAPGAFVLVPAQNTSGTYAARLERLCDRYGPERVALEAERVYTDFSLPCRTGRGILLPPKRLASLPPLTPFFSPELCANYASYTERGRAHLLLWDDAGTLNRKLSLARAAGIRRAFLYYPHTADILEELR